MRKVRINSLFLLFGLSVSSMAFSQKSQDDLGKPETRKNSIDITLGGSGLFLSANYSRTVFTKPSYFINASAGIGTVIMVGGVSVPHQVTINFEKKAVSLNLVQAALFGQEKVMIRDS